MDYGKEFRDYAVKHKNINGTTVDDVMKFQAIHSQSAGIFNSNTPYIIEERKLNVSQLDVFSRLMMDRMLFISGVVDQRMADVTQAQLLFLESLDKQKDITMQLSSPGGSVVAGLGMRDVMNYVSPDVATINLGMAASMGSILLSSGAPGKRSSLVQSRVMIHQVSSGASGTVMDNRISHMESEKYNYILFKILAENSGQDFAYVLEVAHRDRWLNSKEALDFGFIDEIIGADTQKTIDQYMEGFDEYYQGIVHKLHNF